MLTRLFCCVTYIVYLFLAHVTQTREILPDASLLLKGSTHLMDHKMDSVFSYDDL